MPDSRIPEDPVAELLQVLNLKDSGDNSFQGTTQWMPGGRVFGGQVLAQSLVAASHFSVQWLVGRPDRNGGAAPGPMGDCATLETSSHPWVFDRRLSPHSAPQSVPFGADGGPGDLATYG